MKRIKSIKLPYYIILVFNLFFLFLIAASTVGPNLAYADNWWSGPSSGVNNIKLIYPWSKATTPADFVSIFYKYALGLVGGAALGVLIYGAILYSVSGAVSTKEAAKKWIQGAIWGLLLLLGAYLILYTINPDLVNLKNPALETVKLPAAVTTGVLPSAPSALAINLEGNSNVNFSTRADCPNYNAAVSIQEIAATGSASACDSECNCGQKVQVDPRLLKEVQDLSTNYKITVTSITTGQHEPNSRHYQGRAVDMDVPPSQRDEVLNLLKSQGFNAICEKGSVVTSCSAADHIHFSI